MIDFEEACIRQQKEWDKVIDPEYINARNAQQKACPHDKVFEKSGLCAQCGFWTKEKVR